MILAVCDDGDVFGYYTQSINGAVKLRETKDGPDTIHGDLQPFLEDNVGMSAWGLSVHRNARKIAISANTCQITVITFGIQVDADEVALMDMSPSNNPLNRRHDQKFILKGMRSNLPCVAFCNTDDDPQGRILACGEITGMVYLHDIHSIHLDEALNIGFCRLTPERQCGCGSNYVPHAVWALYWLDKRSFRRVAGYAPEPSPAFQYHWNGTIMRSLVPLSSTSYRVKRSRHSAEYMDVDLNDEAGDDSDGDDVDDFDNEDYFDDGGLVSEDDDFAFAKRITAAAREKDLIRAVCSSRLPWRQDEDVVK